MPIKFSRLFDSSQDQGAYSSWQTYMAMGRMASERGLYAAAARNYRSALKQSEQIQLNAKDLVANLLGLAECDRELGEIAESESLLKRVLEIEESSSPAERDSLAVELSCLAVVYKQFGRIDEAETLLLRALAINSTDRAKCNSETSSIESASISLSLAQVLCEQNRFDEADKYIIRASSACGTRTSQQTRLFAEILIMKAIVAIGRSQFEEAKQFIDQAIEVMELATGGEHPDLADLLEFAAGIKLGDGLCEEAESMLDRALSMRRHLRQIDR